MKRIYFSFFICALVWLVSCTQEIADNGVDSRERARQNTTSQEVILNAFDADATLSTKTVRDESTGGVLWSPGDAINLFYGSSSGPGSFFVAQNTEPSSITTFRGNIDVVTGTVEGSTDLLFWGIYPYNSANRCTGESANILLPDIQRSGENSWGEGALVSIGRSQGLAMGFYNLFGGIIFYVTNDDIREIVFRGKNNEPIAGSVTVAFNGNTPTITAYQDTVASLHLLPPSTYTRQAFKKTTAQDTTWYFMTLPPRVYSGGHTITFYKNDGTYAVRDFPSRTITRNRFTRIRSNSLDNGVEFVYPQLENNQIRYTATAKVEYAIPESSTTGNVVESNVFNQTTHVGTITFANAITGLDHDAFFGNEDLISVTLPDGLEDIEFRAFAFCPNLVSVDIPSSVHGIGWAAFKGCTSLEHIYVPELIGLGEAVFANCLSLRSFSGPYASADGKVLVYHQSWNDEDNLVGCALKSFEGQDLIIPEGIDVLGEGVFAGGQFASVSIPETVKEIEESCFESCVILSNTLTIPGSVTTIGDNAFYGCSNLQTIILDRGSYAGLGSEGFEWPGLPTLGEGAFDTSTTAECTIKVPGAFVIGSNAGVYVEGNPWYAYRNQVVVYQADNELWYSHENEAAGIPVAQAQLFTAVETSAGTEYQWVQTGGFYQREHYPYDGLATEPVVPYPTNYSIMPIIVEVYANDVIAVSAPASHLSQKQYVSLPHSLEVIGKEAFKNASSLLVFPAQGANLTSIGESAFYGCSSMAFPDNGNALNLSHVSSLGAYAFYDCQQFGSGSVNAGSILFLGPVTTIPERAFYQCKMLTHIYVSQNNIATVGIRAFYGCNALKALAGQALLSEDDSVHLPATTSLGIEAFAYCSSITDVTLGSVVTIPKGAFGLCSNLKTVSLNTGTLTTIGPNAFAECRLLRQIGDDTYSVNLPYVKTIDNEAFSNCQSISEIRLPNIHVVGNRAFAFTRGLESISFGRFLNTLGELIFYDNSTSNSVRNYDKLTLYFYGNYPDLVSALNSTSPTFGYTSQTNYFWPKNIRVENQSLDVLEVYNTRLPGDWNEAIRDKIQLYHIP